MTGSNTLARLCANVSLGKARTGLVLAAAGLMAASAQSTVIFDTLTGPNTNFNPGFAKTTYSQCFICVANPTISELGDVVGFAGTDRLLTTTRVTMAQAASPNFVAYNADITFKIYSSDGATLLASKLETVNLTLASANYTIPFDFTSQNVVLPNTVYYGISIASSAGNSPIQTAQLQNLWLGLWDYYTTGFGGDGQAPNVGTDPGTTILGPTNVTSIMYGRLAPGNAFANSNGVGLGNNDLDLGYTANVEFNAVMVPEPATYGLMALGLLAVGAAARRKSKQ